MDRRHGEISRRWGHRSSGSEGKAVAGNSQNAVAGSAPTSPRNNLSTDDASVANTSASGDIRDRSAMLTTENLLSIHNSKIGDSLVRLNNQPVQIDHVIPNFISKHTRDWCDRYLQRVGTVADKVAMEIVAPSSIAKSGPATSLEFHGKMTGSLVPGVGMQEILSSSPGPSGAISNMPGPTITTFLAEAERSTPHLVPSAELTFAAVVMADVSGYSLLTSRLAELGPSGAEILGRTMKGYLDKIISTILSHGGDIVKFAGDAVIFYWPLDPRKDDIENEQTRGEIVLKASYCCLDLLHHCNPYPINLTDVGMKELRIHLGIGSGYVYDVHVGEQYRWEHFIAGDGVNQIAAVLDLAKPGQLAMSHQALRSLQVILELQSVTIGNYDKKCIILEGLEMARRKVSPPLIKSNDDLAMWDIVPPSANVELYRHFVNESALFKLQADVSQSRIFRMESGLNDLLSLTELRQITTVFIRIGSLRRWDSPALLGDAQEAMTIADRAVKRYEGDIRQFHVDEKGAVILAFFGLPPKAHENDATFGIKAALEICTRYLPLFDDFSVGITTGVVSIGGVGNSIRTEYAVMGDSINMAARLMCHAEAKRSLLCDERSYNLADTDFVFDKLGETMVKGKSHPIAIFRPRATLPERTLSKRGAGRRLGKGQLVGRLVEKDKIISELKQFEASGNAVVSSVLVFEAEGGQGLSTLLDYARVEAANYKLAMCTASATETEKSTPFYAWRDLLRDLFNFIANAHVNDNLTLTFKIREPIDHPSSEEDTQAKPAPAAEASTDVQLSTPSQRRDLWSAVRQRSRKSFMGSPEDSGRKSISMASPESGEMQRSASSASTTMRPSPIDTTTDLPQGQGKLKAVAEDKEIKSPEAALATPLSAVDPIELRPLKDSIRIALQRVGYDETRVAHLFGLVFPGEYELPQMDHGVLISGKSHIKELSDVVCRLIKAVLASNRVILGFPEGQWMDSSSWELLYDVLTYIPNGLPILIFTRLISTYENEQNTVVYNKMRRHNLTSFDIHTVEGLTLADTHDMIIVAWPGALIKGVHPDIVEQIFNRTEGKPLYIESLVMAFQESGQYRIDQDSILTTQGDNFNFDHIFAGQGHRSIITAQYDRLDRTYQLFLKIASALGERFHVEDVTIFFKDMPVFTEAFRVDQKQVPRSIDQYDKYGFLTRCESPDIREGVTYQFKSDAVRKCIYYMMVLTQRQQLHLNIALHYENRITKDKDMRPALLISLFEHYMQTDDRQVMKRIKYMEEVAGFYWEKRLVTESIKHYRWLISTVQENEIKRDQTFYTADTRSDWHRHLAEAYMWKDDVVNAEINALQSLKCLGCPMPTGATRLEFEIRKSRRNEKAWRKEWVPWEKKRKDAEEMDPVHRSNLEAARDIYQKSAKSLRETSQIELAGSFSERADIADQPRLPLSNDFQSEMRAYLSSVPEQLHANLFSASPRQYDSSDSDLVDLIARDPRMARQHKVRLTLLILAEINLRLDRRRELMWCITTGLNLCYNFPLKIIFGRFLALWALYLSRYETKKKFKESPEYARAAASKERSGDIFSSIHLHETIASFYFDNSKVLGNAEHALDHYEKALSAAKLAGDKVSISRIWRLKSLLLFWTVKRIDSQKEAQAYLTWAFDEENDEGKFYASAILSANLLEGDRPNEEIEECSSKMSQAVNRAVVGKGDHIAKILYDALNMKTNFKLGRTVDPAFLAEAGNAAILERTSNAHQPMANLAYFVFYDVNRLIWRLGWHDQQSLGDNLAILSFMSRRLKKIMKWQYPAEPVYYAIASLKAEIRGQVKKAHESFCKSYRHTASLSYFDGKLNFHHFEFLDKVASTKQLRNYNEYVLSSKALADTVMKQMGMAADSPDQYMEGAW